MAAAAMRKVIHLLPYDGIGGVEAAARTMKAVDQDEVRFRVRYLFPNVSSRQQRGSTFNPLAFLKAARDILREDPDVLIVSLWRAAIVGVLVRMLRPRVKLVVLLHNSVDAHFMDFLFTRWAIRLSSAVWADSEASVAMRFRRLDPRRVTVISFLANRIGAAQDPANRAPTPTFAFWGRLVAQKNLARAIGIFHRIWRQAPQARFVVIGPDCGELSALQAQCASLGLGQAVEFAGAMDLGAIRAMASGCSFYLQTSDYEGMAMSVVEAMQMGMVPVVTPVGEIGRYCVDGENAVVVHNDEEAAREVLGLLEDADHYRRLSAAAIQRWQAQPLYRDDIMTGCMRLVRD